MSLADQLKAAQLKKAPAASDKPKPPAQLSFAEQIALANSKLKKSMKHPLS